MAALESVLDVKPMMKPTDLQKQAPPILEWPREFQIGPVLDENAHRLCRASPKRGSTSPVTERISVQGARTSRGSIQQRSPCKVKFVLYIHMYISCGNSRLEVGLRLAALQAARRLFGSGWLDMVGCCNPGPFFGAEMVWMPAPLVILLDIS
jgi:hypothetical protein